MQNPGDGESKRSAEAGRKWKTEEEREIGRDKLCYISK